MADTGAQPPDGPDPADAGEPPLRVVQFTDLHLYADPDGRLLGQNTRLTFESVIALARQHQWPPDALVLTGDLIHDEHIEGYRFLRKRLEALGVPCFCIPGNHDRMDLMVGFADSGSASGFRVQPLGLWDLILLDSTVPFEEGGHIENTVLADLDRHAAENVKRNLLIFLHHHPEPIGSSWIDTMLVDNGAELLATAARHYNVRGIFCGHVHQVFESRHRDRDWKSTPSTCIQFLPGSADFALDALTPGFRWFDLYPDGRLETAVMRTNAYPEPLHASNTGY
ncbi:MAG: metallophosphoesterase [Thiohalocapsa sp.]